jgi:hypothetical protein
VHCYHIISISTKMNRNISAECSYIIFRLGPTVECSWNIRVVVYDRLSVVSTSGVKYAAPITTCAERQCAAIQFLWTEDVKGADVP